MLRARSVLLDHLDRVAETLCHDTGKPKLEAMTELFMACDALTFYARKAKKLLGRLEAQ